MKYLYLINGVIQVIWPELWRHIDWYIPERQCLDLADVLVSDPDLPLSISAVGYVTPSHAFVPKGFMYSLHRILCHILLAEKNGQGHYVHD